MDYRNVCCFIIFILAFFCYESYKENKELSTIIVEQQEILEKQNDTILYQNNVLNALRMQGFYSQPQSIPQASPIH